MVRSFVNGPPYVTSVAISAEGDRVLIGSTDKTAKFWATDKGARSSTSHRSEDCISYLTIRTSKSLVFNNTIQIQHLFEILTAKYHSLFLCQSCPDQISCASMDSYSRTVGKDSSVPAAVWLTALTGHQDKVTARVARRTALWCWSVGFHVRFDVHW